MEQQAEAVLRKAIGDYPAFTKQQIIVGVGFGLGGADYGRGDEHHEESYGRQSL